MIQKMIVDLLSFIAFILIVLIGFGVSYQGIVLPAQPFDIRTFINIFYRY